MLNALPHLCLHTMAFAAKNLKNPVFGFSAANVKKLFIFLII
jgi:hypothetical protein